jgi:ribose transport system permease protein
MTRDGAAVASTVAVKLGLGGDATRAFDRRRYVAPVLVLGAVIALLVVGGITTPAFLGWDNIQVIIRAASITGIIALGMTFITLSGNFFSLSVAQTASLTAILFAFAMRDGWPLAAALVAALLASIVIGAVQGGVVALGVNPIVTTLGAGGALYGFAAWITNNEIISFKTGSGVWVGQGRPLGIPTQSWAFVILTVVGIIVLRKTRFGRQVMLVGANRNTARAAGVRIGQVTLAAFVLSSLAAGIAGIFVASQIRQGIVTQFNGAEFEAIAAILVGGTAVQGGQGSLLRTAIGTLFIGLLTNFMVLRNYTYGVRTLVVGAVVVIAVSLFHVLRTRTS